MKHTKRSETGHTGKFGPGEHYISDEDLWKEYVETPNSAKLSKKLNLNDGYIRRRLAKIRHSMGASVTTEDVDRAGKLEQLVSSIPLKGPGGATLHKANVKIYGIGAKDELTQTLITKGMDSTGVEYRNVGKPDWPLLQQAQPSKILFQPAKRMPKSRLRTVVVLSDAQIGFLREADDTLTPIHDPQALDVAMQIVADVAPDELGSIGDWLDLAEFSRFLQMPEYANTSNVAIQAGHEIFAQFISAAGRRCKKRWITIGNHDVRIGKKGLEHNAAALGLRRASAPPAEWPVHSLPFLLRFDELGIEAGGSYPAGGRWLAKDIFATHAPPKKLEIAAHVIHGHTHHITTDTFAQHGYEGRRNYLRYDLGCLCKIGERSVPWAMLQTYTPSDRPRTDWAQGIGVLEILELKDRTHHQMTQVWIDRGVATFAKKAYISRIAA